MIDRGGRAVDDIISKVVLQSQYFYVLSRRLPLRYAHTCIVRCLTCIKEETKHNNKKIPPKLILEDILPKWAVRLGEKSCQCLCC
jgi:hypothetical protein